MSQKHRHLFLQRCFWNTLGIGLFRKLKRFYRQLEAVVDNRHFLSETNGEEWLLTQLPEQPTVLDVGFYQGEYSLALLRHRPEATAYAFDPSKSALRAFESLKLDSSRLHFVHAALSDHTGRATFFDFHNMCGSLAHRLDAGPLQESYEVDVMRLDDWVLSQKLSSIDLLKIDAEGYDLNILEGASRLLEKQLIDIFQFEYADGWIANKRFLAEFFQFAANYEYSIFRLFNGFLVPFNYSTLEERFDLGLIVVCVSKSRMESLPLPVRHY